jgi:ABC-type polysaccharide/polyol phosphate export permease
MKKNPVMAAILNLLFFGAGTVYVGKRVPFGIALILALNTVQAVEILVSPILGNMIPQYWPFLIGGLVVTKIAMAADGYREAKAA